MHFMLQYIFCSKMCITKYVYIYMLASSFYSEIVWFPWMKWRSQTGTHTHLGKTQTHTNTRSERSWGSYRYKPTTKPWRLIFIHWLLDRASMGLFLWIIFSSLLSCFLNCVFCVRYSFGLSWDRLKWWFRLKIKRMGCVPLLMGLDIRG